VQGVANPAYLGDFLRSGLLRVAPYCVPGGIRLVSKARGEHDHSLSPKLGAKLSVIHSVGNPSFCPLESLFLTRKRYSRVPGTFPHPFTTDLLPRDPKFGAFRPSECSSERLFDLLGGIA
jgi:hypothetical protein